MITKKRNLQNLLKDLNSLKQVNNTLSYIRVYESVLSPDECKIILDEYSNSSEWMSPIVNLPEGLEVNKKFRNCDLISLSNEKTISVNYSVRKIIDNFLFKKINLAVDRYRKEYKECNVKYDSGYDLLRYPEGGYYCQHTDSYTESFRSLSMTINLNSEYEGGELSFYGGGLNIKTPAGGAVLFPSNFMFPHEILEVTKGTRYSIVTWLT